MSTDKLQALHNTVVEILGEPPSPPTFFDEEPYDSAQASEQVAKASDNLQRAPEIPKENFGKPTSRERGISPKKIQEVRPVVSGTGISLGRWVLRGFAGILLAAGIGVAAIIWLGSPGDATKTSPPQPAPLAPTAPTAAALPPELTPLLQSMARDLASMGKEIEQLKAGRELMGRDNANLSEQLRANQEQLTRGVGRLSEQLKTSQEQMLLDNANMAEQIKAIQDQLARVISKASKQNAPPRIAAAPSPPTAAVARKPAPALSSPQATAQPKAEKPKLSSTSRPPAPARGAVRDGVPGTVGPWIRRLEAEAAWLREPQMMGIAGLASADEAGLFRNEPQVLLAPQPLGDPATLSLIRTVLTKAGVEFIDENGGGAGVRLRKPHKSEQR